MKKKTLFAAVTLTAVAAFVGVITIEKNSRTPVQRYIASTIQENLEATEKSDKNIYIPKKINSSSNNLQYEFLSYEIIDDKDIEKQTKYKAEYFKDGKVPSSDYVVKDTDFDAMARDYPKFDEYRESFGERGMTEAEYTEFMRIHEPEYTTDKHIKAKYLFIKCRITYIGNGRKKEWLDQLSVFTMKGNQTITQLAQFIYFDHPQPEIWDSSREGEYFWQKFGKVGDSIECVLGCRLSEYYDGLVLKENDTYYIGFEPGVYYDDEIINPSINENFVSTDSLPCESYRKASDTENKK